MCPCKIIAIAILSILAFSFVAGQLLNWFLNKK